MELRRKSDNYLISNEIIGESRSGWYSEASGVIPYRSLGGVRRYQRRGVRYKLYDIQCLFGPGYAGSSDAGYDALDDASVAGTTLVFTDAKDNTYDVKVDAPMGKDSQERWVEVVTKDIRKVTVTLYRTAYTGV